MSKTHHKSLTILISTLSLSTMDPKEPEKASTVGMMFCPPESAKYWTEHGYSRIGTAEVDFKFDSQNELLESAVQSLRASQTLVMAEAQGKHDALESRIQNLLALPAPEAKS